MNDIKSYEEMNADEKEILDAFWNLKIQSSYHKYRLYKFKIDNIFMYYRLLKKLRAEIQTQYFKLMTDLNEDGLVEGDLNLDVWSINRSNEDATWKAELDFLDTINRDFEIALGMIDKGDVRNIKYNPIEL